MEPDNIKIFAVLDKNPKLKTLVTEADNDKLVEMSQKDDYPWNHYINDSNPSRMYYLLKTCRNFLINSSTFS